MSGQVYFGMKGAMKWVPAPAVNTPRGVSHYRKETQLLGGGVSLYASATGARQYELTWPVDSDSDLRHILACSQGLYATPSNKGLIYYLDPFAMKTNVLPAWFASPFLGYHGAPNIAGWGAVSTISEVGVTNGYPAEAFLLATEGTSWNPATSRTLWIPVPAGYTFHFGVHGTAMSGGYMSVTPDGGSSTAVTMLSTASSTLTNYSYSPASDSGVTLQLKGASSASTIAIAGMVAQILPTGEPAPVGGFIPGAGNSGCHFSSDLSEVGYSAALSVNQYYTATLKEVGGWLKP